MYTVYGGNNESAVQTSYEVSLLVAEKGKPHTIGEELIKPAAKIMTLAVLGEKASKSFDLIPLSNNTVRRRIDEMAENVRETLINRIQNCSYFA